VQAKVKTKKVETKKSKKRKVTGKGRKTFKFEFDITTTTVANILTNVNYEKNYMLSFQTSVVISSGHFAIPFFNRSLSMLRCLKKK